MLPTEGTVWIEDDAGVPLVLKPATLRPSGVDAERGLFRGPYGSTWFVDGYDLRGVETVQVSWEVQNLTGIQAAASSARATVDALEASTLISGPFGVFVPRGVLSVVQTPIEFGYRVDVVLATDGWRPTDDGVLRLIGGPVWKLR